MMKIYLPIVCAMLSGCVAYPAYYPTAPVPAGQSQAQAQAMANEQCAKSGKVAVQATASSCDGQNCTTKWVCR